ncbi:MAG: 30S ribosomal protein S20 [Mariprofundales bacterium]|nr:30S ribosomal protein S20 [Mariprofundales bacterium]
MANHASALKRARQSEKIRARNRVQRSTMRSAIKQVQRAVDAGDPSVANVALKAAVKLIDGAGSKHLIHSNQASRRVSRLNASVKAISAA